MRLKPKLAGPVALVALIAAVAAGSSAQAANSSAVQATGYEFRINLSRTYVKPGKLRVEFVNFGEDDHDLAVTRKKGGATTFLEVVRPGQRAVKTITTRRGSSYVFWCTISDHKAKGMRAVLKLKR